MLYTRSRMDLKHAENAVDHHVDLSPLFGLAVAGNSVEESFCLFSLLALSFILCGCTQSEIC